MLIIAYNQFKIIMSEFPELENLILESVPNKKILKMEEKLIELLEFPLLKTIMELINLNGLHEFVIITKLSIWDIITQLKKPYLLGLKKSKNFVVNTVQIKTCIMY